MKSFTHLMKSLVVLTVLASLTWVSCKEEEQTFGDDLRVLLTNINGDFERSGVENLGVVEPEFQMVFSHPLETAAFEGALSISPSVPYTVVYGDNNGFATMEFGILEYSTSYIVSLPAGTYGSDNEELLEDFSYTFTTGEYQPPTINFSSPENFIEEATQMEITATLSEAVLREVTFDVEFGGTATLTDDYTVDNTSFTIPAGETTATFTITAVTDIPVEGQESLQISAVNVTNAAAGNPYTISVFDKLPAIELKGVMALTWDGSGTNDGKAIHIKVKEDVADMSVYALGVANNGGGTDGIEFTFPAVSANAGDDILICRNDVALGNYFSNGCLSEFESVIVDGLPTQNGDDAIELFQSGVVVETYGDNSVDGTGEPWEYTGSWAYKLGGEWVTGGVDCTVGTTTIADATCKYPLCDAPIALKGALAILWDGSGTNGGKAVHLVVNKDIPDMSIYGIGVTNNGGGTDGIEFTLPAEPAKEGDHILIAREPATIASYFGSCNDKFDFVFQSDAMNQNGDDGVELFEGADNPLTATVIETYGDANVDGTGEVWEYSGAWAYKTYGGVWNYQLLDCAAGSTSTQSSACPYQFCSE